MSEELNLVRDLAVILIAAGVFTIISKALKQPSILGYILAGFLVGPHIDFFPGISSVEEVDQWSEIGIIFLMFALGLEFSFKKLLKVGGTALTIAGCKFIGVFFIGYIAGQAMNWTMMESVFLAGLLSMSSTTVVIKAYDEFNLKRKPQASLVFGTLVVEDLIAILLMVLLSTMAVSNQFAGSEMLFNLAKLAFFIILWFLVGIFLIPTVLKKTRKWVNDEILLVVSIGLCFGMVTLASAVGFSSALGAFVMGSILAETVESEHIMHLVGGIKDLFGAIFFVSVGMMVDPAVILEHWFTIIIITLLVYAGHIIFAAAGVILSGKKLETAVHTGFSLAQLGEFGFIIASVGVSLGVMRGFIYPVIIAVSVITTFTTPYMIRFAGPTYDWLCRKLPPTILEKLNPVERVTSTTQEQNDWKILLNKLFIRLALYGVIIVAIIIGSEVYLEPLVGRLLPELSAFLRNIIIVGATLSILSPFIYGLAVSTVAINGPAKRLITQNRKNGYPLIGLMLLRIFLAIGIVMFVISSHFELKGWTMLLLIIGGFVFFSMARKSMHRYTVIEKRFLGNLNEKENLQRKNAPVATSVQEHFAGYDVHIETVVVSQNSSFVGKQIKEIPFRQNTGANIVKIKRGDRTITIPSGNVVIYPMDELVAVGTSSQLDSFRQMLDEHDSEVNNDKDILFEVRALVLEDGSRLVGKKLMDTNMREYGCMVLSVKRDGVLITNPDANFVFEIDDIVWIAGDVEELLNIS